MKFKKILKDAFTINPAFKKTRIVWIPYPVGLMLIKKVKKGDPKL